MGWLIAFILGGFIMWSTRAGPEKRPLGKLLLYLMGLMFIVIGIALFWGKAGMP